MIRLTKRAEKKLQEALEKHGTDYDSVVRVVSDPVKADRYDYVISKLGPTDEIVRDKEKNKLLVLSPRLSRKLEYKKLDYSEDAGFVMLDEPEEEEEE